MVKSDFRNLFRISLPSAANFIMLSFFFVLLEYLYYVFVYKLYGYGGFDFSMDVILYLETKALFLLSFLALQLKKGNAFIYSVFYLLQIFLLIPNAILFEFMHSDRIILYSIFLLVISIPLLSIRNFSIKAISFKENYKLLILLGFVLLLLVPIIIDYGFDISSKAFSFSLVYDIRAESAAKSSKISLYAYSWLGKVVLPLIIATGLIRKKYLMAIAALIVMIYLFLIAGHKSVLFSVFVVVLFVFVKDHYRQVSVLLIGIISMAILAYIIYLFTGNLMPESIVVRRTFFIPAQLNQYYFEAFRESPVYLSHSIFSGLCEYPYEYKPSQWIAYLYYNDASKNANSGLISDAYMNFGLYGIPVFIFLFNLLINFLSGLKMDARYFGVFFLMIYVLLSSALFTSLLSHGIFFLVVLSVFLLSKTQTESRL